MIHTDNGIRKYYEFSFIVLRMKIKLKCVYNPKKAFCSFDDAMTRSMTNFMEDTC